MHSVGSVASAGFMGSTSNGRFAEEAGSYVSEEETYCRKAARDDYEVSFDEAR